MRIMMKFVEQLALAIESGSILRSTSATAGPYTLAVHDPDHPYVVYDDVKREVIPCASARMAARIWNQVTYRDIRRSNSPVAR